MPDWIAKGSFTEKATKNLNGSMDEVWIIFLININTWLQDFFLQYLYLKLTTLGKNEQTYLFKNVLVFAGFVSQPRMMEFHA